MSISQKMRRMTEKEKERTRKRKICRNYVTRNLKSPSDLMMLSLEKSGFSLEVLSLVDIRVYEQTVKQR